MHGEPSIRDDSTLLARWAREGNEDAFAEIVRQYQRLVLGAALRRTGDAELAREVAQQVFATLAAKARTLLGRTNVAGWLYRTASHIGARAAQAERRRRGAHERLEKEPPTAAGDAQWPLVEDALARLGESERESLVLHFFQNLSYPEMARTLSIGETAARKRVSRALHSLETQLRRRGIGGSATALLTAAAAQQAALPAQAGLAAAALAAAPVAIPLSFTLATLMSQTTLKVACTAALIVTPLALEWKANADLRAEIAKIRSANPQLTAAVADADPLATAKADLAAKHTARLAAENRVAELLDLKNKVENEVVVSFGTVDAMAKKIASITLLSDSAHVAMNRTKNPTPGELSALRAQFQRAKDGEGEISGLWREIPRLERVPEKAARFYATLYGEMAGLDETGRAVVEKRALEWQRELQNDGLARPQRPNGKAKEWDDRREASARRFFASLTNELPAPKPPLFENAIGLRTDYDATFVPKQ